MVSKPVKTSALVTISSVLPLSIIAYLSAGKSSQPQRRARPVVLPNSWPCLRSISPSLLNNSVGKGPLPTRVQ